MDTEQKSKADIYREHVLKAENFSGSSREYCRRNGLSAPSFYAYKSELGLTRKARKSFVKVDTADTRVSRPSVLPDPKWTAEFLRYFLNP